MNSLVPQIETDLDEKSKILEAYINDLNNKIIKQEQQILILYEKAELKVDLKTLEEKSEDLA